jgi:hypothetical protein
MAREMSYCVEGGCGGTIFFGLTDEGVLYAELGGDVVEDEDELRRFARDCGYSLEDVRAALEKLPDE